MFELCVWVASVLTLFLILLVFWIFKIRLIDEEFLIFQDEVATSHRDLYNKVINLAASFAKEKEAKKLKSKENKKCK